MRVVDFAAVHIEQAARIAKQNYDEERGLVPVLPAIDKAPDLSPYAENGLGVAAFEGDSMLGFLCSVYASFDVYVANGYESENNAMNEWLETNKQGYSERLLGNTHYCVEYYDERFKGNEADSIVEIWIPIIK